MHNRTPEPLWGYTRFDFVRAILRLFTLSISVVLCTAVRTPLQGALNVAGIPARRTRDQQAAAATRGQAQQLAADRT